MNAPQSLIAKAIAKALTALLLWSALCFASLSLAAQQFGVCIHIGQNASLIDSTLSAGPFSYRTDALWRWVEATQGVLTYPNNLKGWLDPITNTVVNAGAKPLLMLDYGNPFYDGGGDPTSPEGIAAYAKYAGFMASHYKGTVSQFEIWNEWNVNHSSTNPLVGTAGAYVNLLRAAYHAIKAANPNATVVAGSVTNLDSNWINQFIQAGGLAYADAFSVHPYVHGRARRPSSPAVGSTLTFMRSAQAQGVAPIGGTPEDAMAWVDKVHTTLDNAAGKTVPIFVTEIGWATNIGKYGFAENTSAAYLQRFLLMAHARPWIGGVWWYDLFDDGSDSTNYYHRFGLLQQSGAQKPAYTALMQIKNVLVSPTPATESVGSNGEITISGTLASGRKYYAAWLPTDDFNTNMSSPSAASLLGAGYSVLAAAASSTTALGAAPLVLAQQ